VAAEVNWVGHPREPTLLAPNKFKTISELSALLVKFARKKKDKPNFYLKNHL